MNRSLLLIVCDFLLLSILALARFDVPKDAEIPVDGQKVVSNDIVDQKSDGQNYDDVVADLEEVNESLEGNLDVDQKDLRDQANLLKAEKQDLAQATEQLKAELAAIDDELAAKKAELNRKDSDLKDIQRDLKDVAQDREALAQAKNQLEAKTRKLEAERAALAKENETTLIELAEARERNESLSALQAETAETLTVERERNAQINQRLESIDTKVFAVGEGLQDVGEGLTDVGEGLKVVGNEVKDVRTDVADVRTEVADVREDVVGVGEDLHKINEEIAGRDESQKKILRDIIQKQPNTLNEIYTNYLDNVVKINLKYKHLGGFLGSTKEDEFDTETILLTDGAYPYALIHIKESPFRLTPRPRTLVEVDGSISGDRLGEAIPIEQVAFLNDPKVFIIPLLTPLDELASSGLRVFKPVKNPHVFANAVVVDSDTYNFGETSFTRDPKNEHYIRLRKKFLSFLRGEFSPSKGDLVFAKTGEVLGIMVNDEYAYVFKNVLKNVDKNSRFFVGEGFDKDLAKRTLTSLGTKLSKLDLRFR